MQQDDFSLIQRIKSFICSMAVVAVAVVVVVAVAVTQPLTSSQIKSNSKHKI